ncbi:MAG: Transcriptional regulator, XRE family [Candidatus Daviesbacteria bacterium GW2011_GWB1_41_5]|uniref:Transcriptional regulator, XRE family n=1 Tax=Candidatus Daviesbacteria bacterium GW2011_GWB1_41_5 TaxID=1618429 RepID=A0A0G0WE87_9BACT|nr:MAG: Transcriptional regulator, XRE family [Candidatus Daviesbacteria bacterium GW2011_GWB1_41_5]
MRRYKIDVQVGRKIAFIRKRQKLSQEEAAERTGVHLTTLGRIERGETNPPLRTLHKIAKALKVHIRDFFY